MPNFTASTPSYVTAVTYDGGMNAQLCRRQLLGVGAGVAAASVLTSCSGGSDTPAEGTVLADAADIPEGTAAPVLIDQTPIILSHAPDGTFRAFSAICTHQGCKVVPDDAQPDRLVCPCHHSEFATYTGNVLTGPAREDLTEYEIRVKNGQILLA